MIHGNLVIYSPVLFNQHVSFVIHIQSSAPEVSLKKPLLEIAGVRFSTGSMPNIVKELNEDEVFITYAKTEQLHCCK